MLSIESGSWVSVMTISPNMFVSGTESILYGKVIDLGPNGLAARVIVDNKHPTTSELRDVFIPMSAIILISEWKVPRHIMMSFENNSSRWDTSEYMGGTPKL